MDSPGSATVILSSYLLVALAEIGDKSQLVCMTMAARHHPWPVLLGAALAFALLNLLAVLFGAGVAAWLPEKVTAAIVAIMFAAFGIHSLLSHENQAPQELPKKSVRGIFITTLLLIFVAEFGDKTQIVVAGLASSFPASTVWVGATVALVMTSALGIWAGRTILQRLPLAWINRLSGGLFLVFAVIAAQRIIV